KGFGVKGFSPPSEDSGQSTKVDSPRSPRGDAGTAAAGRKTSRPSGRDSKAGSECANLDPDRNAEVDLKMDPASVILSSASESPGFRLASDRRKGEPGPDTGLGLAQYFTRKIAGLGKFGGVPDPANQKTLASHFNRWKKNPEFTPDKIRAMIDFYVAHPEVRNPEFTPWLDFYNKRAKILAQMEPGRINGHDDPNSIHYQGPKVAYDRSDPGHQEYWDKLRVEAEKRRAARRAIEETIIKSQKEKKRKKKDHLEGEDDDL